MHPTINRGYFRRLVAATAFVILIPQLPGQVTPAAAPDAVPPAAGDVTILSPYIVDTSLDRGYQAVNTLSGTRLNSSLRDAPASISVMTKEFLEDIGLDSLGEIVRYSVNSEVDEFDTGAASHPDQVNSQYLVKVINTRGIRASQALDYFKSITPDDSYRVERYDDSRGPNGILFGVSDTGGLINQTSKVANTLRDRASIKWSGGNFGRNRTEVDLNKIVHGKSVAISLAGLHQENGGWKLYDFQDKQRLFGSVVIKPHERISVTFMGEKGHDTSATAPDYPPGDQFLAWFDNRQARGLDNVLVTAINANPTAAQQALGITARNAAANGTNRRITFIANDGQVVDVVGNYITGSYNNPAVRAPDGTPGRTGSVIRINDQSIVPYEVNAPGPGMFRDTRLKNYTVTADLRLAKGLYANLGHNFQKTDLIAYFVPLGSGPNVFGEPNRTLGLNGPANPYGGGLYIENGWRRGTHNMHRKENRLSLSYDISRPKFGSHRLGAMVARVNERDSQVFTWLALAGAPFGGAVDATNNRVTTRRYVDERDPRTFFGGDWREVPSALTVAGRTYDVIWANAPAGGTQNVATGQELDTGLLVAQSHFFSRRLVTTLGYRDDRATFFSYGFSSDPIVGGIPDFDPAKATESKSRGITRTHGAVLHVGRGISLIANGSSNVGLPEYIRRVLPNSTVPEPSKGTGRDYGIAVDFWNRKLTAKATYYETTDVGKVAEYGSITLFQNTNVRIMDAFESVLVGTGRPVPQNEWAETRADLTRTVNAAAAEVESTGYELSVIANPLPNLRVTVNYAYTDRSVTNLYVRDVLPWYGYKLDGRLVDNPVTQDATGRYNFNAGAIESGGTLEKWHALSQRHPDAGLSTLTTSNGRTVAEEIFVMAEGVNDQKRDQEKRWGLRPHRVSFFAAYDFKSDNFMKGVTVGGGYRWRSPNIIGEDANGGELSGRPIRETDLMLRYARMVQPKLWKGRLVFQLNVINVFDDRGITPRYLSINPVYEVPGGRGIAYNRFDVIAPRTYRFTTTYEF
jgi:iron complex outermembrane recepter protein